MKAIRHIVAWVIFAALGIPLWAQTSGPSASPEYLIKAGFTYNFAKLMQWPDAAFPHPDSPIVIGVLGADSFGNTLRDVLAGKTVNGRGFVVKHVKLGPEVRDCNILFVSASETAHLDEMFRIIKGLPILTIGETPNFAHRGGIINFVLEDDKVHFEVNVEAAKQADITISSRLLALARIVPQNAADGGKTP
jgi:hypothetical protein